MDPPPSKYCVDVIALELGCAAKALDPSKGAIIYKDTAVCNERLVYHTGHSAFQYAQDDVHCASVPIRMRVYSY